VPAARAALAAAAAIAAAAAFVSGGSEADPRTPPALPGLPPPFLGTAVVGDGGATGAVDAYGSLVDLRASPAGPPLLENPSERQAAGTVPTATGIVPRLKLGGGPALPPWRADGVVQGYRPRTNVVETVLRFGEEALEVTHAGVGRRLAVVLHVRPDEERVVPGPIPYRGERSRVTPVVEVAPGARRRCRRERRRDLLALLCDVADPSPRHYHGAGQIAGGAVLDSDPAGKEPGRSIVDRALATIRRAAAGDRAWLRRGRRLGPAAPDSARRLYARSLLVLRALTDRRTGAVAAGARDGWAYVWPRDAGTAALAFAAAGYRPEAARIAHFLRQLDLGAAARFYGDGAPVPGRGPQGDAAGWVAIAAAAVGARCRPSKPAADPPSSSFVSPCATNHELDGEDARRPDYQEGDAGDFLGNALAESVTRRGVSDLRGRYGPPKSDTPLDDVPAAIERRFGTLRGLVRDAADPGSGLDSAAAWAVRPFRLPSLFAPARRTMLRLLAGAGRFGITPGEGWDGEDPWSAPTAWTAGSLAALAGEAAGPRARADRRAALRLLAALRRSATPAGALPERVDAETGIPTSTTPLAWSHAFAILALRQLWPEDRRIRAGASAAACCGSADGARPARR
jgi:hypothetical protein